MSNILNELRLSKRFGVPWPWVKLFCLGELLEPLCTILTVSLGSIFQVPRPIKFGIEVSKEGGRAALKLLCPPMKAYWPTEREDSSGIYVDVKFSAPGISYCPVVASSNVKIVV